MYYAASLIQDQGIRGKWDYNLKATYVIAILNFEIERGEQRIHRIALHNQSTGTLWSPSLQMVFLEIPKGPQDIKDCKNHFERWLFMLGNLHRLTDKPRDVQEAVFQRLFEVCEIGKFPEVERVRYIESLSTEERMEEALKYAKMYAEEVGLAKGLAEGRTEGEKSKVMETVRRMLSKKYPWSEITEITGVKEAEWKG